MGIIPIPELSPIIHQPFMGGWFTEDKWATAFNIKYENSLYERHQDFANSPSKKIVFFFKTNLELSSSRKLIPNNLMMALATLRRVDKKHIGYYMEINELEWIGVHDVDSWKSIQEKLPDNDIVKIFKSYELPVVWLGQVNSYINLLDKLQQWMDKASR